MRIGTARDVRRLDSSVITDYGIPQSVLMENAAIAARDAIAELWSVPGRDILVVCGSGNNGGDGYALARLLYTRGAAVTVLAAGDPQKNGGAAAENAGIVGRLPLEVLRLDASPDPPLLKKLDFGRYDLIVDALFGIGLSRELEGRMAALVNRINESGTAVLSLDIPSGIDADTGAVLGRAVRADATVAFGIPKRGNLLYPGYELGGRLYLSEISFPPEVTGEESMALSVNVPPPLPPRNPAGHKGSFGKVLVIGGSADYRGAPALAAMAALKAGSGYVRLAVPADIVNQIFPLIPEAVFIPRESTGSMGSEHTDDLIEHTAAADSVVLGPGLSTAPESIRLARDLIAGIEKPLVVDGDALTALSGREELTGDREFPTYLTPHPGEMARLLGSSIHEVETRRVEVAQEAADRYGCCVVLKGAHSIIARPVGSAWINLTGNSGMGTAGSGDVLAGLLGALIPRFADDGVDVLRLAVYLHGLAGDLAAEKLGKDGLNATDIVEFLAEALQIRTGGGPSDPFSGKIHII